MTQTILKEKLARFLKLTHARRTKKLRKDLISEGYCYGLAVCHGAMKLIGKLEWWESALTLVANWNGEQDSLMLKAGLSQSDDPNETVGQVFERVLNYIVFNHINDQKSHETIKLRNVMQANFLYPENKFFEVQANKKIIHIKTRESMGGALTKKQIKLLLQQSDVKYSICLLHSTYHTISLEYKKPFWMLYDPNYSHDKPVGTPIYKQFTSKDTLVDEIIDILGRSVAIEYASWRKESIVLSKWKSIVATSALNLLDHYGLHLIVTVTPQKMSFILEHAMRSPNGVNNLVEALRRNDEDGWYGFHKLALYAPDCLPQVLGYIATANNGASVITHLLNAKVVSDTQTGLFEILNYAPKYLDNILNLVERAPQDVECLAKALLHKRGTRSGWDKLLKEAPQCKKRVLKILSNNSQYLSGSILKELNKEINLPVVRIHNSVHFFGNKNIKRHLTKKIKEENKDLERTIEV